MSKWQTIDTAPTDGTEVLIAFDGEVLTGFHDDGCDDEGEPFEDAGWFWFDKGEVGPCEPTHWMPYPSHPQSS